MRQRNIVIIVFLVLLTIITFMVSFGHASPAPLPFTLQTSGYGPYESPLIQPKQSPWFVTLNYTPLNSSASVTIIDQDRTFRDYKLVPTTDPGQLVYMGQGTAPVYIEAYAANWSIALSY